MNRVAILSAVAVVLLASAPALGQSRYSANGHYYEVVSASLNWADARDAATGKTYSGMKGHLVTITTSGESAFVSGLMSVGGRNTYWIGAFQEAGSREPDLDWQWVTGEDWSVTNWNPGEPNDVGNEDAGQMYEGNGRWYDGLSNRLQGYIVEYEPYVTVSIDSDAGGTKTSSVTLTLELVSGDSTGLSQVRVRNAGGDWTSWLNYSKTLSWKLTDGQGEKTVEAEFLDTDGRVYSATDTIHLDWTEPLGSVVIEGGATWANSSLVSLDLKYSDTLSGVEAMRFRDSGGMWGDWIPAAPSGSFTARAGEGLRTIEVEFRDAAGNISRTASDSILIDLTAPDVALVAAGGGQFVPSRQIPLEISATDEGSGVEEMRFREVGYGDLWDDWVPFTSSHTQTVRYPEGSKTVEVQVKDRAGNLATRSSNTVSLDRTSPVITSLRTFRREPYVLPGARVLFELSGRDNAGGSGVADFRATFDKGTTWSPWHPLLVGTPGVDRPAVDGYVRVRVVIRDGVGNESDMREVETYLVEEDLILATGGGKLTGALSPAADVDAFAVDLTKGDVLNVKVKGKSGSSGEDLLLALDIATTADGVLHAGRYPDDATKVMIKGYVAPETGRYLVLARLDPESAAKWGSHSISIKVKQSQEGKKGKGTSTNGGIRLAAAAGSLLKAACKGEGLTAAHVTVVGPEGPVALTTKEGKGSVKLEAVLDAGTGEYTIRIDPPIDVAGKWKLKLPKKVKAAIQE